MTGSGMDFVPDTLYLGSPAPHENPMAQHQRRRDVTHRLPTRARWVSVLGFVGMFVLMLFLTGIGLRSLNESQARLERITGDHQRKMMLVSGMRNDARERTLSLQKMILFADPIDLEEQFNHFTRHAGRFSQQRLQLLELPLSEVEPERLSVG